MDGLTGLLSFTFVIALGLIWWTSKWPLITRFGRIRFSRNAAAREGSLHTIALRGRLLLTPTHQLHLVETMDELVLVCTYPNGSSVVLAKQAASDKTPMAGETPKPV